MIISVGLCEMYGSIDCLNCTALSRIDSDKRATKCRQEEKEKLKKNK